MRIWPALLFISILAGCRVGPVYQPPQMEVPCEWHSETSANMPCTSHENGNWWEKLQDPLLNQLISDAATQNLDMQMAAIRVLQARAEANAKKTNLYPHIDGSANYGHIYFSKEALVDGLLKTIGKKSHHVRRNLNFYEVGFDADWELDFFGLTAHEIAAQKALADSVQESLYGSWVTLSAEIAKNYIELRGFQRTLEIAQRRIEVQRNTIQLTEELVERGVVNESDYHRTQAELSALNGEIAPIKLNISHAIHRISILLGYMPGELCECLSLSYPMPTLPLEFPIGFPSELLRQRPDIRKVERELAAATERIGSAIASLFPRFSLRGFVGNIATHAGSLFHTSSVTWFAGPQVLVPIFNSRLLLQDVEYNKLVRQGTLILYQKTVLEALEEAENAIAAFNSEDEKSKYLNEAYQHYLKAFTFTKILFQRGITDQLSVVNAQKTLLQAEEAALQSQIRLLINFVALYKALGG